MRPSTLAAALFIGIVPFTAPQAQRIRVPEAAVGPVLLDGRLGEEEWAGAATVDLGEGRRLVVKQDRGHVFLGLRMESSTPRPVDLYLLQSDGTLHQLHASAQIGERRLAGFAWSDTFPAWRWGNHVDWTASEAKIDSERGRPPRFSARLFPADGVEFQIRRERFPGSEWRLRLEIGDFDGAGTVAVYPAGSSRANAGAWAILALDGH